MHSPSEQKDFFWRGGGGGEEEGREEREEFITKCMTHNNVS